MQTILERFRPQRARANQSIESTLGEYLRTVLRDNRRFAEAVAGDATSGNIPSEFQEFLQTLQQDLILAVRAYAVPDEEEGGADGAAGSDEASSVPTTDDDNGSTHAEDLALSRETSPTVLASAETSSNPDPDSSAIPTFHRQRGQNLPGGGASRLGVEEPMVFPAASTSSVRICSHRFPTAATVRPMTTPTPWFPRSLSVSVPSHTTRA